MRKQTFNEDQRDTFLTEWLLYDVRIHKLMIFVLLFSLEIMFKDLRIMFYFQLFSVFFFHKPFFNDCYLIKFLFSFAIIINYVIDN